MAGKLRSARATGKSSRRKSAGNNPQICGYMPRLMADFRKAYPVNTPAHLAAFTGADIKHCEKCLGGKANLGAGFQAALLHSDFGKRALIAIMGDSRQTWWRGFRRHLAISELRQTQIETQRRLAALETDDLS